MRSVSVVIPVCCFARRISSGLMHPAIRARFSPSRPECSAANMTALTRELTLTAVLLALVFQQDEVASTKSNGQNQEIDSENYSQNDSGDQ
ncbi:MAG: hypothetical protein FWD68_06315 [Alphaproteobacteria bacterium]|nr:hypothetical protein [Alphaproteobacteria bacterium]